MRTPNEAVGDTKCKHRRLRHILCFIFPLSTIQMPVFKIVCRWFKKQTFFSVKQYKLYIL